MEKKGTLGQKRRPKGDPNPQKGPLGDPGPLKETQLGTVLNLSKMLQEPFGGACNWKTGKPVTGGQNLTSCDLSENEIL